MQVKYCIDIWCFMAMAIALILIKPIHHFKKIYLQLILIPAILLQCKGNKALKSEILSRSSPHFLISRHDLKILNQNWGSMFGDSKQINWEAGNSNLLFLSNFLEMTCSKFPILRLYYLYYPSDRNWWSCNNLFLGVFSLPLFHFLWPLLPLE